jgi:cyclohexanone monooxygenase
MSTKHVDVVVIGAGFVGIYAVHRLRDRMGLSVLGFDSAADVGGTWYWNQYPGARCDIESVHYSYSFSEELQQDWTWSERYAAQPEILRYLNHVADRFDIRRSFRFNTAVESMTWDEAASVWHVHTSQGDVTTRFIVSGAGNVSIPKQPEFPGLADFTGEVYATHRWPQQGVDLTGKRVAVIGTGASGIQLIPSIAAQVEHLTVFQRTPNFATPLRNHPTEAEEWEKIRANYPQIRIASRNNFLGIVADPPEPCAKAADPAERQARYETLDAKGGFHLLMSSYADLLMDEESNETISEFIRSQIRSRVTDPAVAELLSPRDHFYCTKRPPMETNYYETFNRPNVTLVDVKTNPIEAVTATGLRTGGVEYEFDVLILAMGFDAFTGALLSMNPVGRDGVSLKEAWSDGPRTFLGIASAGFPNLFMITGPQSAIALYNNPLAIEDHVEFASDAIAHVLARGAATIEPAPDAETAWVEQINVMADMTLFPRTDSWYMGANIPGKPRGLMTFVGGAPAYRAICAEVVENDYRGFTVA